MDIPAEILQFGVSLIAILLLAGLAWGLKLGGKPVLKSEGDVREAASEVENGFDATRISISRGGTAALASDANGQIMVIKRHGNRFAGRILTNEASVREEVDGLLVDCGEARFGAVRLSLADPAAWADAINRL